ncbi:unnamed protein product [Arabis nemorensis]|uniref:Uncharacterized protein n=1 Tax=Arabis nemorensis TaxID=586526 RepID=A0A565AXI5_9BRAS|nr:unnamed protein product [Arabis nemorensis]
MEQPSDKASQEQVRESLIAISYTSPEEPSLPLSSDVKPVVISTINTNGGVTKGNSDDAEKLRSELISISYDESASPDVAVSPTLPNGVYRG